MSKKVIIASQNPVKIEAVKKGFSRMFPSGQFEFEGVSVPSGVSDQPMSDSETLTGALNRAHNASTRAPEAHFYVGIEGGIQQVNGQMEAFAWVVIRSDERLGKSRTGTFFLPARVVALIQQGKELGEADDMVFGYANSKQKNGAVGILTDNALDRAGYYAQAVMLALIPFKNPDLY